MSSPSNPLPAGQAHVMRYRISDASGALVVIHCRQDGPDGKRMWWEQPDGTSGLGVIPLFLARPGIGFAPGSCGSCGDQLGRDQRYRCGPCAAAAVHVLAALPAGGSSS
jgi:hypothetical protein